MKLSQLKAVKEIKSKGLWLKLLDNSELKIKVKFITPAFNSQIVQMMKEVKEDATDTQEQETKLRKLIADELVVDYKGLEDEEGKPLAFDKIIVLELLETFSVSANKILELAQQENEFVGEVLGKLKK